VERPGRTTIRGCRRADVAAEPWGILGDPRPSAPVVTPLPTAEVAAGASDDETATPRTPPPRGRPARSPRHPRAGARQASECPRSARARSRPGARAAVQPAMRHDRRRPGARVDRRRHDDPAAAQARPDERGHRGDAASARSEGIVPTSGQSASAAPQVFGGSAADPAMVAAPLPARDAPASAVRRRRRAPMGSTRHFDADDWARPANGSRGGRLPGQDGAAAATLSRPARRRLARRARGGHGVPARPRWLGGRVRRRATGLLSRRRLDRGASSSPGRVLPRRGRLRWYRLHLGPRRPLVAPAPGRVLSVVALLVVASSSTRWPWRGRAGRPWDDRRRSRPPCTPGHGGTTTWSSAATGAPSYGPRSASACTPARRRVSAPTRSCCCTSPRARRADAREPAALTPTCRSRPRLQQDQRRPTPSAGPPCPRCAPSRPSRPHVDGYVENGLLGFGRSRGPRPRVRVCVKRTMKDHKAGLNVRKGCQTFDGATALAYPEPGTPIPGRPRGACSASVSYGRHRLKASSLACGRAVAAFPAATAAGHALDRRQGHVALDALPLRAGTAGRLLGQGALAHVPISTAPCRPRRASR